MASSYYETLMVSSQNDPARDTASSIGRSSCSSRSPVVIPSSQLESNLHEKAAQITKRRHQDLEYVTMQLDHCHCCYNNRARASRCYGCHDDDLMTPPKVLLEKALMRAKELMTVSLLTISQVFT